MCAAVQLSGPIRFENIATTAVGYVSASDIRVHFGLGRASTIAEIEIRWPSGITQVLRNVRADQIVEVTEPAGRR